MNQTALEKQPTLKCKTPIIIFSLVSLICIILSCIRYFVYYDHEYNDGNSFYKLTARFPNIFELFSLLIALAPCVLLVIYIFKFHREFKATIIVPIIFGLLAIHPLYSCIENIFFIHSLYMYFIFDVVIIVVFALAAVNAKRGFPKKIFLIIAVVVGLSVEFFSIIRTFQVIEWYLEKKVYLYLFSLLIRFVGMVALYIALLLFGLKNRMPVILSIFPQKEKKIAEKLSPEQALRLLNDKLDFGMITEEEYQAQRNEIISKL